MKLSLLKVLNEVKIEDVASRARSKKIIKAFLLFYPNIKNAEVSALYYINKAKNEIIQSDIPINLKGLALQWIISNFIKNAPNISKIAFEHGAIPELFSLPIQTIEKYFMFQRYASEKNIMNINSWKELEKVTEDAYEAYQDQISNNKIGQLKKEAKYEKVLETPKYDIFVPHNKAAACFLGLQTKWCTAATQGENYFEHYHKPDDPLFILFDKKTKEKFQINFGSDQFMDAQDDEVEQNKKIEFIKALQPLYSKYKIIPQIKKNYDEKYPWVIEGVHRILYLDENEKLRMSIFYSSGEEAKEYYNENGELSNFNGPAYILNSPVNEKSWIINGKVLGNRRSDYCTWRKYYNNKPELLFYYHKDAFGNTISYIKFQNLQFSILSPYGIRWLYNIDDFKNTFPTSIIDFIKKLYEFLKKNNFWDLEQNQQDELVFEYMKKENEFDKELSNTSKLSENRLKLGDIMRIMSPIN